MNGWNDQKHSVERSCAFSHPHTAYDEQKIYYVFTVREKIEFDDSHERSDRLAALIDLAVNSLAT
jgi:hypothetical protein